MQTTKKQNIWQIIKKILAVMAAALIAKLALDPQSQIKNIKEHTTGWFCDKGHWNSEGRPTCEVCGQRGW